MTARVVAEQQAAQRSDRGDQSDEGRAHPHFRHAREGTPSAVLVVGVHSEEPK
jgi:hypothetical protein